MATRNMEKLAAQAEKKIPAEYELLLPELEKLFEICHKGGGNGFCDAVNTAFYFGFAMGHRATKRGRVKSGL